MVKILDINFKTNTMKTNFKTLKVFSSVLTIFLLTIACEDDITGPETVPMKAEVRQVLVKNSIFKYDILDSNKEDADTVNITVPQGTDVSNLDLDIILSYTSEITPSVGVTDLSTPSNFNVTSNVESRDYVFQSNIIAPSLSNFFLTSPVEAAGVIDGNQITLEILKGTDLTSSTFEADFFGESISPDSSGVIDLSVDNPTLVVRNKNFEKTYNVVINYYEIIEFTGVIYDGTVHPNTFLPGSLEPENEDGWVVEIGDPTAYNGGVAHFTSLDDDNGQAKFTYDDLGLTADPNETTTVFRAKGISDAGEHYFEIAFKLDNLRAKLIIRNDRLEIVGNDKVKVNYPIENFDPTQWNVYRVTSNKNTKEFKVYLNEDSENPIVAELAGHDPIASVAFGDGGGKKYECLVDYIAFDAGGDYSPDELPLNEIIK